MQILKGIGVSPGVTVSTAVVLDAEDVLIPERHVEPEDVAAEVRRAGEAVARARDELADLARRTADEHGADVADIFNFHRGLLDDPSLLKQVSTAVEGDDLTAEYAVARTMRKLAARFERMPDEYLSARAKDVYDVERRVLRQLIGEQHESLGRLSRDVIVIAADLLPSQTAALDKSHVLGFATDAGGRTSHTAIVARAMGIPAVVGLGDATRRVGGGDTVIIDGTRGVVVVDPDERQLAEYREKGLRQQAAEADLALLRDLPAETADGTQIALMANIEFPGEIDDALARGAAGIGLYRTEFLYLAADHEPTEEEHFAAYAGRRASLGGPAAGDPHAGPRRGQVQREQRREHRRRRRGPQAARRAADRAQPVPGRPQHPIVPARPPDVQAAAPRDFAGQRRGGERGRADHVPDDLDDHGAAPGEDGAAGRGGGARGRGGASSAGGSRRG